MEVALIACMRRYFHDIFRVVSCFLWLKKAIAFDIHFFHFIVEKFCKKRIQMTRKQSRQFSFSWRQVWYWRGFRLP